MAEAVSTLEADRVPQVDDSETYWHEATSKNGKKKSKNSSGLPSKRHQRSLLPPLPGLETTKPFGLALLVSMKITHTSGDIPIYWPYTGNEDSWKATVQRIKDKFDIKQYCLCKNFGGWFNYKLWIDITETWNYDFYDETGDSYRIWTLRKGVHSVTYDTKSDVDATIVKMIAWS